MLNYILIFTVLLLLLILFYKLYMLSKDFKENDNTPKSILKKINKKEKEKEKEKDLTPIIEKFIPSKVYNGSKKGYYFGTSKEGTGYYLDKN